MPLPTPNQNETRGEFVNRCMGDSVMIDEFPEIQQRVAVCNQQFENPTEKVNKNQTYSDYPQSATNNAKKALKYRDESGNPKNCGTRVGWERANQLASREAISRDTIARMASFKRHQQHSDVPYDEGCGGLMWDAWGGTSGINWAIKKLEQIDKKAYKNIVINNLSYKQYMKKEKNDLETRFKLYKENKGEMPVIYKNAEIFKEKERYKVVLSEEVMDRDGETVKVDGMRLPENGIPFIDGHDASGSVITRRLGTVKNIRVEGKQVVGEIILVDTIKGNEVKKILDDKEHPFPVSMGFGIIDFDQNTKEIKEWELFELSAVNVPANVKARVIKQLETEDFEKMQAHYKTIKAPMKEFTKSFLSESFCKKVGYEKQGDLLLDVNGIFEVVCNKLKSKVETPQAKKTSKKLTIKSLSQKQVDALAEKIASVYVKSE